MFDGFVSFANLWLRVVRVTLLAFVFACVLGLPWDFLGFLLGVGGLFTFCV